LLFLISARGPNPLLKDSQNALRARLAVKQATAKSKSFFCHGKLLQAEKEQNQNPQPNG